MYMWKYCTYLTIKCTTCISISVLTIITAPSMSLRINPQHPLQRNKTLSLQKNMAFLDITKLLPVVRLWFWVYSIIVLQLLLLLLWCWVVIIVRVPSHGSNRSLKYWKVSLFKIIKLQDKISPQGLTWYKTNQPLLQAEHQNKKDFG